MTDPIEINRQNWDERATIHARDATGDYMLDRFRAGEDALGEGRLARAARGDQRDDPGRIGGIGGPPGELGEKLGSAREVRRRLQGIEDSWRPFVPDKRSSPLS